jgi:hypothetical protein
VNSNIDAYNRSQEKDVMKIHKIACALLAATFIAGIVQAADAPKDNKGYTTGKTVAVELGPEFAGMDGRQLRLRVLTIEPGGHVGRSSDAGCVFDLHRFHPHRSISATRSRPTRGRDDG